MKNVLITGAAGFIGKKLCEFYLIQNWQVYGLDNFCTSDEKSLDFHELKSHEQFHFERFDITHDWAGLQTKFPRFDFVFHLASPASVLQYQNLSLETMWANSWGLKNAIAQADQCQCRLIFTSTSEIYGSPQVSPQSENYWGHVNSFGERSCYDESKRFGEALIYSSNKKNKTRHGVVRIFNTYGPGMLANDGRVITQFIYQALKQKDLTLYGDGAQTRCFCYVDDLITGLARYAETSITEPVNLGNDEEITILDLAKNIIELTGSRSQIVFKLLPADDPPQRRPDLGRARSQLNFENTISLRQGLEQMIASVKTSLTS
ncbi:MAG: NAD-dependent epimerase/dehydratase family protein [Bdellovibrionaceae bacterium]|nr:NAD-dependent epimerase/dehydratase family protein [Bdellovibrio sp.]